MAIKPSGPLALSEIAAEFGVGAPMSLSQFYRGNGIVPNNPQNQNVPTGGAISFSNFYNATRAYTIDITSNRENLNLFDLFCGTYGNPGGLPVIVTFVIHGGVTIGGTYGNWALWVGQFPAGSDITINNYGSILGHHGERNSGGGGSCVYGAFGSQHMVFNNYGAVYAGGGGGGVGGPGGQGGPGYYINTRAVGQSSQQGRCQYVTQPLCSGNDNNCNWSCQAQFGGNARCEESSPTDHGCVCNGMIGCFYCKRCYVDDRIDTSGGGGGGGGAGGYGQGYTAGRSGGDPGGGGSPGGQNAGYGGTGGTGGTGGGWGEWGGGGNTGDTGGAGNAGGGSPGGGGAGGGPPGNYLVRGGADFAFNNAGSVAGGVG